MDTVEILRISASILALIVAVVGHEIMHGWVAYRYGDPTAKSLGRLSINPIRHIDPIGTILVPGMLYAMHAPFLFGWAKPVPIDMNVVIRNGGYGAAVAVSLAGITYNLLLAAFSATLIPLAWPPQTLVGAFVYLFLAQSVMINVVLAVFNLWPIPPLDGSQALRFFAAKMGWRRFVETYERIYPYGMIILFAILFTPLAQILFVPVDWILRLILPG
ncbi:site-2 protease family protein [Nitratifractor sp.]